LLYTEFLIANGNPFSDYKSKDRDNEGGSRKDNEASSSTEIICKNPNAENTVQNISLWIHKC